MDRTDRASPARTRDRYRSRRGRGKGLFAALALLAGMAGSAGATVITQTYNILLNEPQLENPIEIPLARFDPALGTLNAASIVIDGYLFPDVIFFGGGDVAAVGLTAIITDHISASVAIAPVGGEAFSSTHLGPFYGPATPIGPIPVSAPLHITPVAFHFAAALDPIDATAAPGQVPASIAFLAGTGFAAGGYPRVTSGAVYANYDDSSVLASVSITYDFTPIPAPGGLALLPALGAMAAIIRRRFPQRP